MNQYKDVFNEAMHPLTPPLKEDGERQWLVDGVYETVKDELGDEQIVAKTRYTLQKSLDRVDGEDTYSCWQDMSDNRREKIADLFDVPSDPGQYEEAVTRYLGEISDRPDEATNIRRTAANIMLNEFNYNAHTVFETFADAYHGKNAEWPAM